MFGLIYAVALAAQVTTWPSPGDWDVARGSDRCLAYLEYEGEGATELVVTIELDGSSMVLATNSNWTTEPDRQYPDMALEAGRTRYAGAGAKGSTSGTYKRGFTMPMPAGFLDDFAQSDNLKFFNGEALVDSLNLKGSAIAVRSLRACITAVRHQRDAEDRERQRLAHIPTNPFAAASAPPANPSDIHLEWARPPRPTEADFPQRAQDRNVEGSATVECTANSNGRPSDCRILAEDPPGMGFGSAAIRVVQRGQLSPRTIDRLSGEKIEVRIPFDRND